MSMRASIPPDERYSGFVPAEDPAERPWEHELEAAGRLPASRQAAGRSHKVTSAIKNMAIEFVTKNGWNCGAVASLMGIAEHQLRRILDRDPIFRDGLDAARANFLSKLEAEAVRRAYHGIEEDKIGPGGIVYTVRKYSDDLLKFLMRANAPEKYSDRIVVQKTVDVRHQIGFDQLPAQARLKILEALEMAAPAEDIRDVEARLLPDEPESPQNGPEPSEPPTDVP